MRPRLDCVMTTQPTVAAIQKKVFVSATTWGG
ncbi:hypothetical protein SALBM311S_06134 [Streptomyces alboniger]